MAFEVGQIEEIEAAIDFWNIISDWKTSFEEQICRSSIGDLSSFYLNPDVLRRMQNIDALGASFNLELEPLDTSSPYKGLLDELKSLHPLQTKRPWLRT